MVVFHSLTDRFGNVALKKSNVIFVVYSCLVLIGQSLDCNRVTPIGSFVLSTQKTKCTKCCTISPALLSRKERAHLKTSTNIRLESIY